jgi:hypothetical protein
MFTPMPQRLANEARAWEQGRGGLSPMYPPAPSTSNALKGTLLKGAGNLISGKRF